MTKICIVGDVNVDIISVLGETLKVNSDTNASNQLSLGGSPCNMAMWLSKINTEVNFLAAIGDDLLGNWITDRLSSGGVNTEYLQIVNGEKSGTCIILVGQDGQRTMLPDPGANLVYQLSAREKEVIESSSVVVMSAYSFLRPQTRDLAKSVVEIVQNSAARLVLDAASTAPIVRTGVDLVRDYLLAADLLLANEDEFAVLMDPKWLKSMPEVLVKLGADGSKWLRYGEEVCSTTALPVNVMDTTGAGDSFLAGVVSVLVEHEDWYAISDQDRLLALIRGSEVAAMNVSTIGAGPN